MSAHEAARIRADNIAVHPTCGSCTEIHSVLDDTQHNMACYNPMIEPGHRAGELLVCSHAEENCLWSGANVADVPVDRQPVVLSPSVMAKLRSEAAAYRAAVAQEENETAMASDAELSQEA